LRKKRVIPLAASGVKRTPPKVSLAGSNTEERSASFRGFVPEVSPIQETGSTPAFGLRDESGSEASYQGPETSFEETHAGASTVTSSVPERSKEEGEPKPEVHNLQATRRVKHLARKKKFGAQERLAEIISEAERMWGKPIILPSDAEEVRQESTPSGEDSVEERDEVVSIPQNESLADDFMEEGIPRTPSSECPETPPLPNSECEMGHAPPPQPSTQEEPPTGTHDRQNTEEPRRSQQVGDQDTPDAGLAARSADRSEASQHLGDPEEHRVNTGAATTEADLHPEASNRGRSQAEASTSELRPSDPVAAPNTRAAPSVGPSSSSRVSVGFEVLGRGFLGHPMEAIKNLILEGFLGNAGVSSPERIAQGILISHYQVSFRN
jgi:hypothetical protein